MWRCSKCGEKIVEESDACWNCGTVRDGAVADDSPAETEKAAPPGKENEPVDHFLTDADLIDEDDVDEDEIDDEENDDEERDEKRASAAPTPDRPLTEAGFAMVMLRLLGICLATFGVIGLVTMIGRIVVQASKLGLDWAFDRFSLDLFIYPGVELIVGIYLLIGGQWVFDRLLTPARRTVEDDESDREDSDRDGVDSRPASGAPVRAPLRTWTSADGKFTTRARLSKIDGETAVLKNTDGEVLNVPLEKLCGADRKFVAGSLR